MVDTGWLGALIAKVLHEIHEAAFGRSTLDDEQVGRRIHLLGDLKDLLKRSE
jgi:hypothetical protein